MNVFRRLPRHQKQRDRWLTLIDIVQNQRCETMADLEKALADRGHPVTRATISNDIHACNIYKVHGAYTTVPYNSQEAVEEAISARIQVAVKSLFYQGDIVVMNTQVGAGSWVASAVRELDDVDIVSILDGSDSTWILCGPDRARFLYQRLHGLMRRRLHQMAPTGHSEA